MRTPVCEAIGIDYPIFQAGMGMIAQGPKLAAAVSEAGGLGVIGTGLSMRPDELRQQIGIVRSVTSKPFGGRYPVCDDSCEGKLGRHLYRQLSKA